MQHQSNMVSIIVPIYNMEKYLERCVESILRQSYEHFEIILVDDGSKDNSVIICKKYEKRDSRIKLIKKANGGVSTARNAGVTIAQGEWIMFVDPDDYLQPNMIERLIGATTSETDISMCTCTAVTKTNQVVCHFFSSDRTFKSLKEKKELYKQLMDMAYGQIGYKIYTAIGVPWGKIYRNQFLINNKIKFNADLRRNQDNIFNIYAFNYAREIQYIDAPLYMYRYEHIASYFNHYRSNYVNMFTEIRKAKYEAMQNLGLLYEGDLYRFYINETLINEATIMKNGVFHKENQDSFWTKIRKAKEISKLECFSIYMNNKGFFLVNTNKYKAFWILLRFNMFGCIYFISCIK